MPWIYKKFKKADFSFLFLNKGLQAGPDTASTVYFFQAAGGIAKRKSGPFDMQVEFYHQFGRNGSGTVINAQLAAAAITYDNSKVELTIGTDYLSGTGRDEVIKERSFTPFYGTNHAFYGFMDYFYVGNAHFQNGYTNGLIDIFTKPVIKLSSKVKLITAFHQFLSPVRIYSTSKLNLTNSGKAKSHLGTEIDLVLNVDLYSSVNLKIGYSQLFATESLQVIKAGGSAKINNWAWVMMTFKPVLL